MFLLPVSRLPPSERTYQSQLPPVQAAADDRVLQHDGGVRLRRDLRARSPTRRRRCRRRPAPSCARSSRGASRSSPSASWKRPPPATRRLVAREGRVLDQRVAVGEAHDPAALAGVLVDARPPRHRPMRAELFRKSEPRMIRWLSGAFARPPPMHAAVLPDRRVEDRELAARRVVDAAAGAPRRGCPGRATRSNVTSVALFSSAAAVEGAVVAGGRCRGARRRRGCACEMPPPSSVAVLPSNVVPRIVTGPPLDVDAAAAGDVVAERAVRPRRRARRPCCAGRSSRRSSAGARCAVQTPPPSPFDSFSTTCTRVRVMFARPSLAIAAPWSDEWFFVQRRVGDEELRVAVVVDAAAVLGDVLEDLRVRRPRSGRGGRTARRGRRCRGRRRSRPGSSRSRCRRP